MEKNKEPLEVKIGQFNVTITCEQMGFDEVMELMGGNVRVPHEEFIKILEYFGGQQSPRIKWEIIKWCLDTQKEWDEELFGDSASYEKLRHFPYLKENILEYFDEGKDMYCIEYETELDGKFTFHAEFNDPTIEDIAEFILEKTAREYDSDYERLKFYKV